MKISVVIPTYWTSTSTEIQHQTPNAIYDHPTPLESQSTLPRLLRSLKSTDIPKNSTTIAVIVAVTHQALEEKAKEKTKKILSSYKDYFDIKQFSVSTLRKMTSKDQKLAQLLRLYGYSNVRNIGSIIAQILESDVLVFLDDDVVVNDSRYFHKAQEYVGSEVGGKLLGGVAGYYVNEDGNYYLNVDLMAWWKSCWPKERKMNEAFKIIESKQRLSETTFAFGGNMILHWKMFERVPFDPYITRGEDMDLLVNARMFGFKFMLDTELRVLHSPGEMKNRWSEMRQDLYRFLYMREKLLRQEGMKNVEKVLIKSLKPYPGYFLTPEIPFKFAISNCLNSFHSLSKRKLKSFREFTQNTRHIPSALSFARKHCLDYFGFQKKWSTYVPKIRADRNLRNILKSSL